MPPLRNNNLNNQQQANSSNSFVNDPNMAQVQITAQDPFRTVLVIFFIISLILSIVSEVFLRRLESINLNKQNQITQIEASLGTMPLEEMLTFYNKTVSLNSVLSNRNNILSILNLFSNSILKNVVLTGFTVGETNNGTTGLTANFKTTDKEFVVKQIDMLKSDKYSKIIKSVNLNSVSSDLLNNVSFSLEMQVLMKAKPDALGFDKSSVKPDPNQFIIEKDSTTNINLNPNNTNTNLNSNTANTSTNNSNNSSTSTQPGNQTNSTSTGSGNDFLNSSVKSSQTFTQKLFNFFSFNVK